MAHAQVRALHRHSVKLPEGAGQLKLGWTTVRMLAQRGELEYHRETDTSGARSVPRASGKPCWIARHRAKFGKASGISRVPFAEVVRFTGLGRPAIVDLVRAGILEEAPEVASARAACEINVASREPWLAEHQVSGFDSRAGTAPDPRRCCAVPLRLWKTFGT
jgi:hypothetical protein